MSEPLVTCICLTTAARIAWLPRAIEYFRSQTYAMRELLIVSEDDALDWVVAISGVRGALSVRVPRGLTLGAKHNEACSYALGDLIAKWDDDDYSAPGRLADQVGRLQASGKALTGYAGMKFTDGANWWRYVGSDWPIGTSLMFRKSWWEYNQFPNDQVGSDVEVTRAALLQRQAVTAPAGNMMAAAIHAGNTNNRTHRTDGSEATVRNPRYFAPLDPSEAIPAMMAGWPAEAACFV